MTTYLADSSDFTGVADHIRAKGGTTAPLEWPAGFVAAIDAIQTSAPVVTVSYDGVHATVPDYVIQPTAQNPAPTATGYTFLGWYADEARTQAYDFSQEVAEDMTLYAKWSIDQPTVTPASGYASSAIPIGSVTPAGSGQTVSYSTDGESWSDAMPTANSFGEHAYTCYWKISADACDDLAGQFTATVTRYNLVTWAGGTDAEIDALLAAAGAGAVDLYADAGWRVGDTRTVSLSAMAATGVGESHVAQNVELVLVNRGGKQKTDGSGEVQFVWHMKNFLANGTVREGGYMNSSDTNSGGWDSCARRTWCNDVFYNALPDYVKSHVKQVVNPTTIGSRSSTIRNSNDYCFLPSNAEVGLRLGTAPYSNEGTQWGYYTDDASRIKRAGADGSALWWLRSPYSGNSTRFCYVDSVGTAYGNSASLGYGLAVAGCF